MAGVCGPDVKARPVSGDAPRDVSICWHSAQIHDKQRVADVGDEEWLAEAEVVVDVLSIGELSETRYECTQAPNNTCTSTDAPTQMTFTASSNKMPSMKRRVFVARATVRGVAFVTMLDEGLSYNRRPDVSLSPPMLSRSRNGDAALPRLDGLLETKSVARVPL